MSYYDDLGLPRTAGANEIKERYRELALVVHPDRGGDAVMFRLLNEAYEVLGDPEARRTYDASLAPPAPSPPRPPSSGTHDRDRPVPFEDLPPYARDRWIIEEQEIVPATALRRWWTRSNERAERRRRREIRAYLAAVVGAGLGFLAGQLTSDPAAVSALFAFAFAVAGPPLYGFVRTGRR
jgi:curved DNA-binding protein CbpA